MGTATFDTLKFMRRLKDAGIPEEHAAAKSEAVSEAFKQALDTQVATRLDIVRLEGKFDSEVRVMKWMLGFNLAFTLAMFWKMFIG